jgi:hypothetical protein
VRAGGLLAATVSAGAWSAAALPARAATAVPARAAAVTAPAPRMMELQAALHGSGVFRHAGGHASYMAYSHRELHVRLWNVRQLAGHRLAVFVHGARAGAMRVSRSGYAALNLYRGVPACKAGQFIQVRTVSGRLVASGKFAGHHRM